jgi:hypothetical protein
MSEQPTKPASPVWVIMVIMLAFASGVLVGVAVTVSFRATPATHPGVTQPADISRIKVPQEFVASEDQKIVHEFEMAIWAGDRENALKKAKYLRNTYLEWHHDSLYRKWSEICDRLRLPGRSTP